MRLYPVVLLFVLFSCGGKNSGDEKICDCLEAGRKLNEFSATLFSEEITPEKQEKMKALKAEKEKKCKDFQTMSGEEMLKRKEACH